MKAAAFDYVRATSVEEVCARLADDPDARIIAGGQTLVPMMAMRLARPSVLIDIARIAEMAGIEAAAGSVTVGAVTRQCNAESSPIIARLVPLLHLALGHVGHPPTRARGTVGGSIANADPSAEIPLVATILGATFGIRTADGAETIGPQDFFLGPMLTAMPEGGCLEAIGFPVWPDPRIGAAFDEISARRSDYAYVSAGAQVALDDDGRCLRAVLGVGGVDGRPAAIDLSALEGAAWNPASAREVIADAVDAFDALDDLHASGAYRRRVAREMAQRVLDSAWQRAGGVRHAH